MFLGANSDPNAAFAPKFTFTAFDLTVRNWEALEVVISDGDNEAPGVADQSFGLDENLAAGTAVGTVAASDPDDPATPFGTLSYAITAGNAAGLFAIDDLTGEITTTAVLDHEAAASHGLTVAVTDGGTPGLSDTALITIDVTDVNEMPDVADQSFGLDENLAAGTAVGTVAASDPDDPATPFGTLSYAITAGNAAGLFAIDDLTGEITTTAALDHEVVASHGLTVAVTDGGTPGLSDTALITIDVNDVNEAPDVADQSFGLDENLAAGTVVGMVAASDPDDPATPFGTLSYAITAGNAAGLFAIDELTGEITTTALLDHEAGGEPRPDGRGHRRRHAGPLRHGADHDRRERRQRGAGRGGPVLRPRREPGGGDGGRDGGGLRSGRPGDAVRHAQLCDHGGQRRRALCDR